MPGEYLEFVKKLRAMGVAQDGLRPEGVHPDELAEILPRWESEPLRRTLEDAAQHPDVPIEKCGNDTFRLTSSGNGEDYIQRHFPGEWWF